MTQDSKNMINNFLIKHFSVKRVKNKLGKWIRVIKVTDGYLRDIEKIYKWGEKMSVILVTADLIEIIINVYGCTDDEANELAVSFINERRL